MTVNKSKSYVYNRKRYINWKWAGKTSRASVIINVGQGALFVTANSFIRDANFLIILSIIRETYFFAVRIFFWIVIFFSLGVLFLIVSARRRYCNLLAANNIFFLILQFIFFIVRERIIIGHPISDMAAIMS